MVKRTTQAPVLVCVCATGAVIAIFWLAACCATGAVMAMLCRRLLPPLVAAEDVTGEQTEALARGFLLVAGDRNLGSHERGIVAQLEGALAQHLFERRFFNRHCGARHCRDDHRCG